MSRIVVTSNKPIWLTLAVALVIHIGLISVQGRRRIDTSFVRTWLMDSLAPMEKLVDRSLYGVTHVWERYFALIGLHDENQRLTARLNELEMQMQQQREEVLEARRLREMLTLQELGLGKTIVARVIGRDPARSQQTVTIDKGLSHGVRPDSAVITAAGIVGRVIHSSNFFSIVQLIVDSQSAIGVMQESTRRLGVLKGTGARFLELEYIDDDTDLKEAEKFLTSGQDRVYPKGLPVGVIISVGPRRGLFKTVQIRPAADLGRLEEVLLVPEPPESVDVIDPAQGTAAP
jgi:rod shape-determining protein MreC